MKTQNKHFKITYIQIIKVHFPILLYHIAAVYVFSKATATSSVHTLCRFVWGMFNKIPYPVTFVLIKHFVFW
jgi:hypothetical protein